MNEAAVLSAIRVLGAIQQYMLGVLASKDLIDLRLLHTEFTQSVTEHLSKKGPDDLRAQQSEAEATAFLDLLFSQAMRIENELRDPENKSNG